MPPAIPAKRALPPKESALFKELLMLYEAKQLKKGVKTADTILKKFPEHGETLCMKGLLLTHMGKREEGVDLVKKGVRLDLTSHIVWHVFGLIQKGEKNYEEALKSYSQALRFDRDNMNILRDAAQLQSQLRIYDGLVDTRMTLLRLRPNMRQHWIALAVAYHLTGNLAEARKVLEHYQQSLKNIPDYNVENSETMLYYIRILEDVGDHAEALAVLDVNAKSRAIVDRTAIMEFRARLLSKLQSDEAEHAWRALVEHNSDNINYYKGYLSSLNIDIDNLTSETRPKALSILNDFSTSIPRAAAPRRLMLTLTLPDPVIFTPLAKSYIESHLSKGIPSLFVDLKSLYSDFSKRDQIESIAKSYLDSPDATDPTARLWTLYFLAQHHSFLCDQENALAYIEQALLHTPTLPELHTCKARILKRAGDLVGAAKSVEQARLLDGQDRFLNTKAAKYLLRAGKTDQAEKILGLFTKKDAPSPGGDLTDMQSMFYLVEDGDAHFKNGHLGLALKRYLTIDKVFDEIEDDQYDFHGYSLRKFVINAYINMLVWEDTLRAHPAYVKAALNTSRIYVSVHDNPSLIQSSNKDNLLSEAEKKAKKKAKKAANAKAQEEKKAPPQSTNEDKGLDVQPPKDDDQDGSKALASPDGLEKAAKMLSRLPKETHGSIHVWFAIYDVAVRRKKYLQAIQALTRAKGIDPESAGLHERVVHLRHHVSNLPQLPPSPIGPVLASSLNELIPEDIGLETFNSQYLQRHSERGAEVLAVAKVQRILGAKVEEIEETVFSPVELSIKMARDTLRFLESIQSSRADEYRQNCDERFGLATVFKTKEELEKLWKSGEEEEREEETV